MATLVKLRMPLLQVAAVLALLGLWQWGTAGGVLDTFIVGTPGETFGQLKNWIVDGTLLRSSLSTLQVLLLGWGIGTVLGVAIGAMIGLNEFFRLVTDPFITFFNGMPRLVLYPFLAVWLGFGIQAKILLVVLVIVVVVATIVATGFRDVDNNLIDNSKLMGARRFDIARDVYAPSLASWLIGSSRVTLGYAFQAAITAEFIGSSKGLGFLVVFGESRLNVNEIWAALAAVIAIAWALDGLVGLWERRALRWSRLSGAR
ncbi:ABC transporter permease [Dactylosporangium sp. NPDC000555]|uniref:ABC transporter permease n=1 Tax=Dactylosporangium sp. NPDC000555 TaxID=3154260 RepID=UPI0033348F18